MNIIAFYLPQFHEIPENNEWWGDGFTEWINMKNAKQLFDGHYQPRVPLNKNYYNLLDVLTMKNQIQMAKNYGIYGFCFYHYWFEGKRLLEKPVENYLSNTELDLPFCLSWANESWTNAWVSSENKVLLKQTYGQKQKWKQHFDYLLPYFKDLRYIKEEGMPLFIIYRPELIGCLEEMLSYWQALAAENGLLGIKFAYQHYSFNYTNTTYKNLFSFGIEYQPNYALNDMKNNKQKLLTNIKMKIAEILIDKFGGFRNPPKRKINKIQYDRIWEYILKRNPENEKMIPGAFVDWDNSPRRGLNGSVFVGATPSKFGNYLKQQIIHAKKDYKKNMIFIFAWNEWAEGGYLEPDERYKYSYLEELKAALIETNEFPTWN